MCILSYAKKWANIPLTIGEFSLLYFRKVVENTGGELDAFDIVVYKNVFIGGMGLGIIIVYAKAYGRHTSGVAEVSHAAGTGNAGVDRRRHTIDPLHILNHGFGYGGIHPAAVGHGIAEGDDFNIGKPWASKCFRSKSTTISGVCPGQIRKSNLAMA